MFMILPTRGGLLFMARREIGFTTLIITIQSTNTNITIKMITITMTLTPQPEAAARLPTLALLYSGATSTCKLKLLLQ